MVKVIFYLVGVAIVVGGLAVAFMDGKEAVQKAKDSRYRAMQEITGN